MRHYLAQTAPPCHTHTLLTSSNPPEHPNLAPSLHSLQKMIDWSLIAVRELARRSVGEWPAHRLLSLSLNSTLPSPKLQAIDVKLVKSAISQAAVATSPFHPSLIDCTACSAKDGLELHIARSVFLSEDFRKRLKGQFIEFMGKIIKAIREGLQSNEKTAALNLDWKESAINQIFESTKDLIVSCKSSRQILALIAPSLLSQSDSSSFEREIKQFKQLLARLSGDIKVKMQLYQQFQKKVVSLQQKQEEEGRWMDCCQDLQSTVRQQIQTLSQQQSQKEELQAIIQELNQQLLFNQQRVQAIQRQMAELEQELKEEKQVQQVETYYLNPMYDRAQLQEKLLTEMIQTESDLLEVKGQNQMMADALVEIIKLAQSTLEDFHVSKYLICSFNRSVHRLILEIKSLENVDFQQLLNLKEDTHSIYQSEICFEETRRSHISSYSQSQTELDQKLSRITEDDIPVLQSQ